MAENPVLNPPADRNTVVLTSGFQINNKPILENVSVKFEGVTAIGPIYLKPQESYTFMLGTADRLPFMLVIAPIFVSLNNQGDEIAFPDGSRGKNVTEAGTVTYADKAPNITFPAGANDKIKQTQRNETLREFPSITTALPLVFFNNGGTPFPTLEKVTQIIFWNNEPEETVVEDNVPAKGNTVRLDIFKAYTPGKVNETPKL